MEREELKNFISLAQSPDWFERISMDLNFRSIGIHQNLKGFSSIFIYFQDQLEGWRSFGDKIPKVLESSMTFFKTVIQILIQIAQNAKDRNEAQLNIDWRRVNDALTQNRIENIFTYDCPETEFLIKINETNSEYVKSVHSFLIALNSNEGIQPTNPKNFIAYLIAYEFVQKDHTQIVERRNTEKASLSRLRNDFQKYLSTSEQQLDQFLKESKQKSEDYIKIVDELKQEKETDFNSWYNGAIEKHENFVKETTIHRKELENTYRELLRLKEPAAYWKLRATKLQTQGRKYMNLLITLIIFSAGLLFFLLGTISNGSFEAIFNDVGKAIKWSIVFVSFLSFLAYGARLLAKVIFSSFHLARDAEEREHLTYLYLSLHKDGNIENEDRQLVLQSLFSRADTGLLKDDSSPSMPGSATNIIEKVMTK